MNPDEISTGTGNPDWFETVRAGQFPANWETILQQHLPMFRVLPEADRCELRSYIRWFLASKQFEGGAGLAITDEIRVLIAAQACLLLLHRETPCYQRLHLIRVYPGTGLPGDYVESAGRDIETSAGQSCESGVVLLTWDSVRYGAANPFDGDNVVLHEFAHQLDHEDGHTDGTPLLGRGMAPAEKMGAYTAWAKMLSEEYEQFRRSLERGDNTVLDSYGGTDKAEFFAVATECFFEKPKQLSAKYPTLYEALKQFYKQDPATWPVSPPPALPQETANINWSTA